MFSQSCYELYIFDAVNFATQAGADPDIFQKEGVEEKNFERRMFVDTRINACTHKNYTNMQLFLSSSFSRGLSSIFALFYYTLVCF